MIHSIPNAIQSSTKVVRIDEETNPIQGDGMGEMIPQWQDLVGARRLTPEPLAQRVAFLGLSTEEQKLLSELASWVEESAERIAKRFYDFQFGFEPARRFFEGYAVAHNLSLAQVRQRLEQS